MVFVAIEARHLLLFRCFCSLPELDLVPNDEAIWHSKAFCVISFTYYAVLL